MTPCILSDARGNTSVVMVSFHDRHRRLTQQTNRNYGFQSTDSPTRLEKILRTTAIELGLGCAVCANPLSGAAIKSHGVPNTLSQAWFLGKAVHTARRRKTNLVEAIVSIPCNCSQCTGWYNLMLPLVRRNNRDTPIQR